MLPHSITQEGENQALKGAKRLMEFFKLKNIIPSRIISSSLLRAYQTSLIIKQEIDNQLGTDLEIIETDELTERRMGSVTNLTVDQIETVIEKDPRYKQASTDWKSSRDYKLPFIGTESLKEVGLRVFNLINTEASKGPTIFIGHGASFRNASIEFGILQKEDLPKLSIHYAEPLIFEKEQDKWDLVFGDWKIREKKDKID